MLVNLDMMGATITGCLIPFFKTSPFAFHWIVSMSIFIIKAVSRIEIENGAAQPKQTAVRGGSAIASHQGIRPT